jgi:hypothetical protein
MTESTTAPERSARPRRLPMFAWGIGLVGHLVMLVWFAASGLVAPLWAVGGLLLVWAVLLVVGLRLRRRRPALMLLMWAVLLVVGLRLRRRRPALMLLMPVVDVAIWVAVINAGERFLGWTA